MENIRWITKDGNHIPIKQGAIDENLYSQWHKSANNEMKALVDVGKGKISHWDYSDKLNNFIEIDSKLNRIASENYSDNFKFNSFSSKSVSDILPDGSQIVISGHHGTGEHAGKGGVAVDIKKNFKETRKNFNDYETAYRYANELLDKMS